MAGAREAVRLYMNLQLLTEGDAAQSVIWNHSGSFGVGCVSAEALVFVDGRAAEEMGVKTGVIDG